MLKTVISRMGAVTVAALLSIAVVDTASAKSKAGRSNNRTAAATTSNDSALRARADSRDPSGDYRGFPDWARFALGASRGGNSR